MWLASLYQMFISGNSWSSIEQVLLGTEWLLVVDTCLNFNRPSALFGTYLISWKYLIQRFYAPKSQQKWAKSCKRISALFPFRLARGLFWNPCIGTYKRIHYTMSWSDQWAESWKIHMTVHDIQLQSSNNQDCFAIKKAEEKKHQKHY